MLDNENAVELITCESGDWEILKLNGEIFTQGHSIRNDNWLRLLKLMTKCFVFTKQISDEDMENIGA